MKQKWDYPMLSDKKEGHSQGKDYNIYYGNKTHLTDQDDIDEGKSFSHKQQRESGLVDRKPL